MNVVFIDKSIIPQSMAPGEVGNLPTRARRAARGVGVERKIVRNNTQRLAPAVDDVRKRNVTEIVAEATSSYPLVERNSFREGLGKGIGEFLSRRSEEMFAGNGDLRLSDQNVTIPVPAYKPPANVWPRNPPPRPIYLIIQPPTAPSRPLPADDDYMPITFTDFQRQSNSPPLPPTPQAFPRPNRPAFARNSPNARLNNILSRLLLD